MTVEERLLFIRAGYSAQDIANFEKADYFAKQKPEQAPEQKPEQAPEQKPEQAPEQKPEQAPEQPEQAPEQPEKASVSDVEPAWAKALAESIKTLTAATQAANRRLDDMGEPEQAVDKALDALKEIYGGKTK